MPSNSGLLSELLLLAERRVRTVEGSRLYGKPIGSVIGDTPEAQEGPKRPITIERLKSLQAQFEAARRVNNTALMKDIQEMFSKALREYQATRQDPARLRDLVAARGRQDQAKVR